MTTRSDVDGAVIQALTAEHFTLQGALAATIHEANGRQQAYLGLLSAVIVALAFIAQVTEIDSTFFAFAGVLLPLVYVVGLATLQRLHQIWGQWLLYQIGMNRIRRFFAELHPDVRQHLVLPTSDEPDSIMEAAGISNVRLRWSLGISDTVGVTNSIVAGVFAGLAARELAESTPLLPWLVGGVGFLLSPAHLRATTARAHR